MPSGTKCAIVFDSAPGPGTFAAMHRAFTTGIRIGLMKHLAKAFLGAIYVYTILVCIISRSPWPMLGEMAALNDPGLLPWTSVRTPRLYLYSSGDQIVRAAKVEEHAAQARTVGFPVQMAHFGRSAHVSHARDDPDKYWGSIAALWERTNSPTFAKLCRL